MLNMKELVCTLDKRLLVVLIHESGAQLVLPACQVIEDLQGIVAENDMLYLREFVVFDMVG